jgi:hypothetical protein
VLTNTLVPVVSTVHLVVQRLTNTTPSPHIGHCKNPTNQVRVAQRHALLELLFAAPTGWAQYPSQSLLWSTVQFSLHASMEISTKPSRRWQPSRVTSTTGLQHEHLVSFDAISWCNRTRITHSQSICNLASISELNGSQALLHKPHRHEGAQQPAQGWSMLGFKALKRIEPLYPFTRHFTHWPNSLQGRLDAFGHQSPVAPKLTRVPII